jgi:DNA-binding response OmpR family regulator
MIVLLISDDTRSLELLAFVMRQADFVPLKASTVEEALVEHEKTPAAAAIVEGTNTLEELLSVCRELRQSVSVPIVVITPWNDEFNQLALYEAGADDCVDWPYSPRILEAKLRILRRLSGAKSRGNLSVYQCG